MLALPIFLAIQKGPYLQEVGPRSAVVRVEVDPPAPVTLSLHGGEKRTVTSEAKPLHSISIDRLSPRTHYTYEVLVPGSPGEKGEFVTAPDDASRDPFRFVVYGDSRTGDSAHAAVVNAIRAVAPDFLVNTGDYVQDGDNGPEWQTFFDIERPLLRDECLFACVGNHELYDNGGALFTRYLSPASSESRPGLFGTFRWGSARFFILNAFHDWSGGDEVDWLKRELSQADNEAGLVWRFVVVHHGPWSAGPHGNNPRLESGHVPELLASHKVDLVLSGHDHIYERGLGKTASGPLRYVVSGGGGAPPYRNVNPLPSSRKVEPTYHYVVFGVSPERVTLEAKRVDGTTIETCGFAAGGADWDCDGTPSPAKLAASVPVAPAASPSPAAADAPVAPKPAASSCGCSARGAGSATSGALALLLALVARRRVRR
jgi:3',5'-cyclic AMP phosphodiesterase CpdA